MSLFTSSAWFIEFPEYDRHFQPDLHCLIFKGILWPFRRCVDLLLSAVCWKLRHPVCVVRDTANTSTSSSPLPADHFHPPVILLSGSGKNRPGLLTGPTCGEWRQSSPCQLWHSHTLLWGPRLTDSTAQWNTTVGQCGGRVRLCGTGRTPLRLSCVYHKITSLHLLKGTLWLRALNLVKQFYSTPAVLGLLLIVSISLRLQLQSLVLITLSADRIKVDDHMWAVRGRVARVTLIYFKLLLEASYCEVCGWTWTSL